MNNTVCLVAGILRNALRPYQFGFVQGHSYLGQQDLDALLRRLESQDAADDKHIVSAYETSFARLIGEGAGVSFASGRMAFYQLMKVLGIGAGDEVILPAFTCAVMPNAVMRTGARPVYADIDRITFGSDAQAIEKVMSKRTRLIVAQHSFGIPCNIDEIATLARKAGVPLVEDCAITLDSSLKGVTVGNWGDAAIFSTDHTKPLNTMIGGFLYTKNIDLYNRIRACSAGLPGIPPKQQKRLYKQLLFEKEYCVPNRYPRVKLVNLIRTVMSRLRGDREITYLTGDYGVPLSGTTPYPYPAGMPPFLAQLGLIELERWNEEKVRRKEFCSSLLELFDKSRYSNNLPVIYRDDERDIIPLRFIMTNPEKYGLLEQLARYIDVESRWFQQPIICAVDGLESMGYFLGSCPVSEDVCKKIVNIPCALDSAGVNFLGERIRYMLTSDKE